MHWIENSCFLTSREHKETEDFIICLQNIQWIFNSVFLSVFFLIYFNFDLSKPNGLECFQMAAISQEKHMANNIRCLSGGEYNSYSDTWPNSADFSFP